MKKLDHYNFFSLHIKNKWNNLLSKTGKNKANKYYGNNKEVLREKAKSKYRELSEEKKL